VLSSCGTEPSTAEMKDAWAWRRGGGMRIPYQFRGSRLVGAGLGLVEKGDAGLVVVGRAFSNGDEVGSSF
jgi:hypothetical protein